MKTPTHPRKAKLPKPATAGPWGIEDTGSWLWIGPMRNRPDALGRDKIADIVFGIEIHGMTANAKAYHRKDARFIVAACNPALGFDVAG